jgi:hypothetical protein
MAAVKLTNLLLLTLSVFSCSKPTSFALQEQLVPERIRAIKIQDFDRTKVVIVSDRVRINQIIEHLSKPEPRKVAKVLHDYKLEFGLVDGGLKSYRVGHTWIGADIAASAYATRWFFTDETFYSLITAIVHGAS